MYHYTYLSYYCAQNALPWVISGLIEGRISALRVVVVVTFHCSLSLLILIRPLLFSRLRYDCVVLSFCSWLCF